MNHIHVCWFLYTLPNWLTIDPLVPFNLKERRGEQKRTAHRGKRRRGDKRGERTGEGGKVRRVGVHT